MLFRSVSQSRYLRYAISVGSVITSTNGSWNNSPTSYTYQWYRRVSGSTTAITSATSQTYTISQTDVGATIYCSVTAKNSAGNTSVVTADTIVVTSIPSVVTAPSISGTATIGSTLTCSTGTWNGGPTFTYQWLRTGVAISGATSSTYVITGSDVGNSITCRVTGSNSAGSSQSVSNSIVIIGSPVVSTYPTISGNSVVGSVLTISNGSWTNSPTAYTYQWKKNGTDISGANTTSYILVSGDVGAVINCAVTATNSAGNTTAISSNSITVIAAVANAPTMTSAPVITGSTNVGSVLTTSDGVWVNSPTSYTYQWMRNSVAISGAVAKTYTTIAADAGNSITCSVTATNAIGSTSSITSNSIIISAGTGTVPTQPTSSAKANPVTYAMTGTRTYNIGTGKTYADPDLIPWGDLS